MGEVYRARDSKLKREVALKVLPADVAKDQERLARFQREAEVLAALNHPNIAHIHGIEESNGVTALVMELVEGEDLSQRVARGRIPLDEALPIAKQIADALEAAHEHGIVHRDLKPANIKVREDGTVKVLDFGLAKALAQDPRTSRPQDLAASPTITSPAMTMHGVILGTAAYMSPEQAKGKIVDKRADIWAFGCVLYEMLTGRKTFEGEDITDTIVAVMSRDPDWTRLPASAPPHVSRLLRRCLEKDARRRLRDIGDARFELEAPAAHDGAGAQASGARARPAMILIAGVVAALAFAGGYLARRPAALPDTGVSRFAIDVPDGLSLSNDVLSALAISPDDRAIVFTAGNGTQNTRRLYVKWRNEAEAKEIPGVGWAFNPFFSPDGRWLGFFANGQMKKISLADGTIATITAVSDSTGAAWTDNGTIVFAPGYSTGLSRVPANGGAVQAVTTRNVAANEAGHCWPDVLPDGDHVLYTIEYTGKPFDEADIGIVSLTTGASKVIVKGGAFARYSPSGHIVYVRDGRLLAVPFDAQRLEVTGDVTTVISGIAAEIGRGRAHFAISRAGSLIFAPGEVDVYPSELAWLGRDGSLTPASKTRRGFDDVAVSPDGTRALLKVLGSDDDIWMIDLTRDVYTRLTAGSENVTPVWAPDGVRYAFASDRNGAFNLYLSSTESPQSVERLTTSEMKQEVTGFSPDGRFVLYTQQDSATRGDIWMVAATGDRTPQPLLRTQFDESAPAVSPDGRWLAYVSDETGRSEVYVQPFSGSGPKRQVSGGSDSDKGLTAFGPIRWSRDRRELFYATFYGLMSVPVETGAAFKSGRPRHVPTGGKMANAVGKITNIKTGDLAPDGRILVVCETEAPQVRRIVVAIGGAAAIGRQ